MLRPHNVGFFVSILCGIQFTKANRSGRQPSPTGRPLDHGGVVGQPAAVSHDIETGANTPEQPGLNKCCH